MIFPKRTGVSGKWAKGSEVKSGTRCKLVGEATVQPSKFDEKKTQTVAKIRFEDNPEVMNVNINNASVNALIDAFGEDSKGWQGHYLTAITEKVVVSGKRVTALYFVPEGYEMGEDLSGYVAITKKGVEKAEAEPEVINLDEDPMQETEVVPF